jgi:hypothetical protein
MHLGQLLDEALVEGAEQPDRGVATGRNRVQRLEEELVELAVD